MATIGPACAGRQKYMPELPEVQTIVSDLNKKVRGLTIIDIWTGWPKAFGRSQGGFSGFKKEVKGRKIIKIWRIGKNIIFDLSEERKMLIHQKMTGHLLIGEWGMRHGKWVPKQKKTLAEKVNSYIRAMFLLSKGKMMAFSDMRKFGKILATNKEDFKNLEDIKNIGPDPLAPNFKSGDFKKLIAGKREPIKKILMDQNIVSGIGNIYADEILFVAKINPLARVEKLNDEKLKRIFNAIKKILKKAVKLRGTSTYDYRDTAGKPGHYGEARLVYQRKGEKCPNWCGGIIKKVKIGGRSAHFCPICQKL